MIRVAKLISRAGWHSRRKAEKLIREGKVKVNGEIINKPFIDRFNKDEIKNLSIEVEGKQIDMNKQKDKVWIVNKLKGFFFAIFSSFNKIWFINITPAYA